MRVDNTSKQLNSWVVCESETLTPCGVFFIVRILFNILGVGDTT